jgi:hypothetical protein
MTEVELVRACINKELEPYGVDYDFVKENPVILGVDWYQFYTFKEGEYEKWREFCLKLFKKKYKLRYEERFSMFDLMYGLKQD